jgi:serine/threonine protein kinase
VYLHANKVRHEDIKPSNILLADGEPYLADFGHSKDLSDASHSNTSGDPRGTPKYWAPEVEDGSKRGLAAADIFSVGAVYAEIGIILSTESLVNFKLARCKRNGESAIQANIEAVHAWIESLQLCPLCRS